MELLNIIKALAHENRLRILNLIKQQDLCVCEIEHILEINQSNASRHLNKLKQADLIYGEKKAQWIYYHINKNMIEKNLFLQQLLKVELPRLELCRRDNCRLNDYQKSGISCKELTGD